MIQSGLCELVVSQQGKVTIHHEDQGACVENVSTLISENIVNFRTTVRS